MRIGVDAGRALHGQGGVSSYTRQLVAGLMDHASGHELVLFDLDRGAHRRRDFERALGPLPGFVRPAQAKARELAEVDVFHAPGFAMPPSGAPRHVFTLHDLTVLSHPGCHTLDNRVRTLVSTADALSRGATMLAVSQTTRSEAMRLLSVPGDAIEVLPPFLDRRFTCAGDAAIDQGRVRRLGVSGRYCLAVGSLEPRKNFGRLLDAWETLPQRLRDRHTLVVVASTGWLQGALRRRLRKLEREGAVRRLSRVPGADLAALYRMAALVAAPSLAEGFGLPVAEAMACGAPVVTSDRSSMPEVAGTAALLVDPEDRGAIADAMVRVLDDDELRRGLRERGPAQAARFAPEVAVPLLLKIYRRAVG
ncbi:MAG: glycosyltransferase family 1 protein [Thermoanaerobaculales bacterium]|jgi:alpha-1,3-rhamnosyl/mannosyltransferase|nr:glycosyltransferase family 1 protein [Thermoanaerobaculales bacterium]